MACPHRSVARTTLVIATTTAALWGQEGGAWRNRWKMEPKTPQPPQRPPEAPEMACLRHRNVVRRNHEQARPQHRVVRPAEYRILLNGPAQRNDAAQRRQGSAQGFEKQGHCRHPRARSAMGAGRADGPGGHGRACQGERPSAAESEAVRKSAMDSILDRAYGKSTQPMEHSVDEGLEAILDRLGRG